MLNPTFDIIVIGGGIIGTSIFYHLCREGYRVALIEKNTIASGCSGASNGLSRCFHLEEAWSDKAVYSWRYYQAFKQNTKRQIDIQRCGFIFIPTENTINSAARETARLALQIDIEWISQSKLKKRFKNIFNHYPEFSAYEPGAVYMSPQHVIHAWAEAGKLYGGTVYEHCNAIHIHENDSFLRINTSTEHMTAKKVVIAAGASSPAILDQLGYTHALYKKMIHTDVRKVSDFCFTHPAFSDSRFHLYGRPDFSSHTMYVGTPKNENDSSSQHSNAIFQRGLNRFSWMKASTLRTSFYSEDCYSTDGKECVMKLTESNSLFIASGFSGGGFKIAPWVGNKMTTLIKNEWGRL